MDELYGGNRVKQYCNFPTPGENTARLADCTYRYTFHLLPKNTTYAENNLKSYTVLCLTKSIQVTAKNRSYTLNPGDSIQVENISVNIQPGAEDAKFLVAGVSESHLPSETLHLTLAKQHKKVVKPWGHELWFNGEHPSYCLKEVMIKQGFRTSLQYHNFKEETNFLYNGQAKLIYKDNDLIDNDQVSSNDLNSTDLQPMSVMHVTPGILHRLEAKSDLWLYEVSTPFLDDVIRVQDDKQRQHGRIESEHVALQV